MRKVTSPHIYYERYYGPKELNFTISDFSYKIAAIANSHQSRTPIANHPWIKSTKNAITDISDNGYILITSTGINSYEISLYLASKSNIKTIIVHPIRKTQNPENIINRIQTDFSLNSKMTGFYFYRIDKDNEIMNRKEIMTERDRLVLQLADIIYPISIRRNGNIDRILSKLPKNQLVSLFRVNHELHKENKHILSKMINPQFHWNYLTHWTTTRYKPLDNEKPFQFYENIINSNNSYAYSAELNLLNIIKTRQINSTKIIYKDSFPMISFTELSPSECYPLMSWNAGRIRNRFEPFGIAIRKKVFQKMGVRPVIYGNDDTFKNLTLKDKPYFQSSGMKNQWIGEKEWRLKGNLSLNKIDPADLIILIPNVNYLKSFHGISKYPIYSLEEGRFLFHS